MNNCGYCKHYLPGKALCGLTKKEVGFLEVKPCYEANTNMETYIKKTDDTFTTDTEQVKTKVCKRCGRNFICDFILGKEQVGTQLSMF